MSSDLGVKLCQPVSTINLLHSTRRALQELLAVARVPIVEIEEYNKGTTYPATCERIGEHEEGYLLRLQKLKETVSVVVYEIHPYSLVPEDQVGLWAGISAGAMRTPLEYALAAAAAVALAQEAGTTVVDDALIWNRVPEQAPADFMRAIKVGRSYNDIHRAAEAMYAAMPFGQPQA